MTLKAMTLEALIPERLFDGERLRDGVAALIADGAIVDVIPAGALPADVIETPLPGLLAPGFMDVQVNGGGGALLNEAPTVNAVTTIARAHRRFGTTGLLPTVITDRPEITRAAVEAVRAAIAMGTPGVLGVHVEGPFINPARKGVHDPAFMRAPDADDLALLTGNGLGAALVTLAPEVVSDEAIARLAAAGVRVAAGHTEASAERLAEARALGLSGYTHLFNAMPPLQGRAPGPVGAALSERDTFCGVIVDLHHVAQESLKAAILAKGRDRVALVTDAMSTVGTDLDGFTLQGRRILRGGGRLTTEDGVLAGSDLDMATAVRNAVHALRIPLEDALVMASLTPARWLGLDHRIGRIAPGYRADLALLDEGLEARATWIAGARENS